MLIALTGGIGSGKSTAAHYFAELGVPVIDADVIARELTTKNTPAHQKIITHLGVKFLDKNGEINRPALRDKIFNDTNVRDWLEQLLHPLILQEIEKRAQKNKAPYSILVIPLLLEKNVRLGIDRVLVIDADEATQIHRSKARDQNDEAQIKKIMATQTTRAERLAAADDVIENNADLDALKKAVVELHEQYLAILGAQKS